MSNQEIIYPSNISIRKLPINFSPADSGIFEHELKVEIHPTFLLRLKGINISSDGILFRGIHVLPETFPIPALKTNWINSTAYIKFLAKNLLSHYRKFENAVWITDTWSNGYFHWLTDALPRLYVMGEWIENELLLLPQSFQEINYILPSLKPFSVRNLEFMKGTVHIKNLKMPMHTAPTGNFNESIIREVRGLITDYYKHTDCEIIGNKIYVSRSKARKRKISNEEECLAILAEYGFKIIYFEDYTFEQQVKIAMNAKYIISNHGAGLTNILFMESGSCVLELRKEGDFLDNCYFSMASAMNLHYFYQLCIAENPEEDAHTANLIIDCNLLRKNIESMLAL